MIKKGVDLIGKRFGKLVVISHHDGSKKLWDCLCDCGNKITFYQSSLKNGSKSCGCNSRRRKSDDASIAKKLLYDTYRRGCAKNRGYSFEFNFEDFIGLVQKNCFYCGISPNKTFRANGTKEGFLFNGLDRIDNDKGYEKDNVVPCCSDCNVAKSNLTKEIFLDRIKRCYEHLHSTGEL